MVEDIVNTGKSLIEGKSEIEKIEGVTIVGASAAYSRTPDTVNSDLLGLDIWVPLIENQLTQYNIGECPMDADLKAYPIRTDLGHGAKYLSTIS